MSTRNGKGNRLGKCDVCQAINAKYTCPRCETVTCSLNCVKRHKKQLDCDGIRVRTKFVPLNKMNENNLLSDYRLLSEVNRHVRMAKWQRRLLENPKKVDAENSEVEITTATKSNEEIHPCADECRENVAHKPADDTIEETTTAVIAEKIQPLADESEEKLEDKSLAEVIEKKKKRKRKLPQEISRSEILIAKSKRVRGDILNRQATRKQRNDKTDKINRKGKLQNGTVKSANQEKQGTSISSLEESNCDPLVLSGNNFNNSSKVTHTVAAEIPSQPSKVCTKNTIMHPTDELNDNHQPISKEVEKKRPMNKRPPKYKNRKTMSLGFLRTVAFTRGIYLCHLPKSFEKRRENTSFFMSNEDCIYWHLKVSFINANFYTLSIQKCAETRTLQEVVERCLQRSKKYVDQYNLEDPIAVYRTMGVSKISVLMSVDNLPNNNNKFYALDMSKTLRENFMGKCIVEYPQLCLALENCYVVSNTNNTVVSNYFEGRTFDSTKVYNPLGGLEKSSQKAVKRQLKKHYMQRNVSEKEDGELTDSSDSNDGLNSNDGNEEKLFKENDFRSLYKDLLSTFDSDVQQLQY